MTVKESGLLSFERDIKALFRELDREEMLYVFDLWIHEDVRKYSKAILKRVVDHTMPCDEPWDDGKIALLSAWINQGCLP